VFVATVSYRDVGPHNAAFVGFRQHDNMSQSAV
jgi:hypothetical protein